MNTFVSTVANQAVDLPTLFARKQPINTPNQQTNQISTWSNNNNNPEVEMHHNLPNLTNTGQETNTQTDNQTEGDYLVNHNNTQTEHMQMEEDNQFKGKKFTTTPENRNNGTSKVSNIIDMINTSTKDENDESHKFIDLTKKSTKRNSDDMAGSDDDSTDTVQTGSNKKLVIHLQQSKVSAKIPIRENWKITGHTIIADHQATVVYSERKHIHSNNHLLKTYSRNMLNQSFPGWIVV